MYTFRGFIAIPICVNQSILDVINDIRKSGADVKLVEPHNIHITLKFLGDVSEDLIDPLDQIMKQSVENTSPFSITLQGAGVFPNQTYIKVIWIGIKNSESIEPIATHLIEHLITLGFKPDDRKFSPHLTIGRVRTSKNKTQLIQIIEKYHDHLFSEQQINSIKLMKSELTPKGPIYTVLREVKFG